MQVPRDFPEEVPFIVVKCTSEIEARALGVQVSSRLFLLWSSLYPKLLTSPPLNHAGDLSDKWIQSPGGKVVPGVRERTEPGGALRALPPRHHWGPEAFPEGSRYQISAGRAGLSQPHSSVPDQQGEVTCCFPPLSLQLSAPVLLSHLYNDLIALAKDLQKPGEEKLDCAGFPSDPIQSMKDLLSKLPGSNYNTLRHLIAHLYRWGVCWLSCWLVSGLTTGHPCWDLAARRAASTAPNVYEKSVWASLTWESQAGSWGG